MEVEITLSKEFMNSYWELSGTAIRMYLALKGAEELTKPDDGWISFGYETFSGQAGIKSTKSLRSAQIELASKGWILDYKRGGYFVEKDHRKNFPNRYKISDTKVSIETTREVLKKMKRESLNDNV